MGRSQARHSFQPPVGQRIVPQPAAEARALIQQALDHVRAGRTREAARCLTARGGIALADAFGCNLLGMVHAGDGRLEQALDAFNRALRLAPGAPDVHLNRALTLQRLGRMEAAIAAYDAVLKARPGEAKLHYMRAAALHVADRPMEALEGYGRALALKADYPEALAGRGVVLQEIGRLPEALAAYEAAVALNPDDAVSLYNRGNTLAALGRADEALASFREAVLRHPGYVEALYASALILHERERFDEALACCAEALRHAPGHFGATLHQANILHATRHYAEACTAFDAALRFAPNDPGVLSNRSAALMETGRLEEALASCEAALALKPDFAEAWCNRSNILQKLQRFEDALASYEEALRLAPDDADALSGRAVVLKNLGRFDEALAAFDRALALDPGHPHALNNRGALLLLLGDFARGWEGYESRWLKENLPANALPRRWPQWTGTPLAGKRILVLDEQGLGDVIQFSRYLPLLAQRGGDVTFLCRGSLLRLLRTSLPAGVRLVGTDAGLAEGETFDFEIPLASLPKAFGTDLASIPAAVSYLVPEPDLAAKWAERVGGQGLRVGICWQGNPNPRADGARAVPLSFFAPLAEIEGVRLISLQKHAGAEQLAASGSSLKIESLGDEFDSGPDAFIDTAAVLSSLDLVVTCDTSVAHLAGALGRPVWVALKRIPDWRWLLECDDTPWYPTMRLFRQTVRGEWGDVFDRIAADLAAFAARKRAAGAVPLLIPGSVGELIDKITILDIKAERIADPVKLRNVVAERDLLHRLRTERNLVSAGLDALTQDLKAVNLALWNIEHDIRICEQRADFGAEFVTLARAVYLTNDRRAALKRQINIMFDSAIVEEKSY
jgi:tetratricopeptide (TPR) repeat protein